MLYTPAPEAKALTFHTFKMVRNFHRLGSINLDQLSSLQNSALLTRYPYFVL